MSGKAKKAAPPELGRKGAYVLRNRAALLRSTREVLATKGKSATIEDIAEHAEVAVSTVYKHFKDKDALISATILAAFAEWEPWAMSFAEDFSDPLEQFVMPMRVFVRLNQTHPHNAQTLVNFFDVIAQIVPQLQATMLGHVKTLTKAKILTISNPEIAAKNLHAILTFAVINQVKNPKATEHDADEAVRIGLSMLGISDAKAKKIMQIPFPKLKAQRSS